MLCKDQSIISYSTFAHGLFDFVAVQTECDGSLKSLSKETKNKTKRYRDVFLRPHCECHFSRFYIERITTVTLIFLKENTIQCLLFLNISKELYENLW